MKCELCKKNIEETFLSKIVGTVVKDRKGKKHYICDKCEREFDTNKEFILTKL